MSSAKFKKYCDYLPILAVICILPFVVYGHIYEYTEDSYGSFLEGEIFSDFFYYTRMQVFEIIGLYMMYRLISGFLQGRLKRPCFTMSAIFILLETCLLISSVQALNSSIAFFGGYQRFEGFFVKTFYLVLALYTYYVFDSQSAQHVIWKACIITLVIECCVGLAQMIGADPFSMPFIQSLMLPSEYEGSEITNILGDARVYLTMSNPNYASIYLAVMIIIVTFSLGFVKKRNHLAGLIVLDVISFAELIATRSRVGILMLIVSAAVWLALNAASFVRDRGRTLLLCKVLVLMLAAGIFTDVIMGLGMWERVLTTVNTLGQDRRNCSITDLTTDKYGVKIKVGEDALYLSFGENMDAEQLIIQSNNYGDLTQYYDSKTGFLNRNNLETNKNNESPKAFPEIFEKFRIQVGEIDLEPMILIEENDVAFYFAYDSDIGYMIYTGNGYYDVIEDIPHIDMHGFESAASGRGYIWSRTIPLIRGRRAFTGWGCDNFYLAYPQNDYLGKAQYSSSPYTIIEKPHSTFLLYCMENGIFAMLCLIIVIALPVYRCLKPSVSSASKSDGDIAEFAYDNQKRQLIALLLIAFSVAFVFNDSSIVISPFFWIAVGAGFNMTSLTVSARQ